MRRRSGFTLVELLIVIGIMLILTGLVVMTFNANAGSDRIRSAGRVGQSAFRGAADRAIHAKANRGLRLIRDPNDPSLVNAFAYLQPMEPLTYGAAFGTPVRILREDLVSNISLMPPPDGMPDDGDAVVVEGTFVPPTGLDWLYLYDNGLLPIPSRIRIPSSASGQWYTFTNLRQGTVANTQLMNLTAPFAAVEIAFPDPVAVANATCDIEIGFELLPNHQPMPMSSGVVIDLDWSGRNDFVPPLNPPPAPPTVPVNAMTIWPAGPPAANIDIMFTPRGMVEGALSARGPIYFLLNDIGDATRNLNPIDPQNKGEKLVLAVFPQTGNVAIFPIDPTDANNDTLPDDLFRFAKLGSIAGQ
jgi:prepilin-type N-terminal cleavage/methylation domain-containing protein